jgi:hypothetical protein
LGPQPPFETRHAAEVGPVVMIVTQKVQKPMERQNLQLDWKGMASLSGLPASLTEGDNDVTQGPRLRTWRC